jgi:chromosome segregation ATPase
VPVSDFTTIAASTVLSGGFCTSLVTWFNHRRDSKLEEASKKTESIELSFSRLERENARQAKRIEALEKQHEERDAREARYRARIAELEDRLDSVQHDLRRLDRELLDARAELGKLNDAS